MGRYTLTEHLILRHLLSSPPPSFASMDRLSFLKGMQGSTALLTLLPLGLLTTEEQQHLSLTEDCQQLFLYDCIVRGFRPHGGPKLLPRMKEMDTLDLVREYE